MYLKCVFKYENNSLLYIWFAVLSEHVLMGGGVVVDEEEFEDSPPPDEESMKCMRASELLTHITFLVDVDPPIE